MHRARRIQLFTGVQIQIFQATVELEVSRWYVMRSPQDSFQVESGSLTSVGHRTSATMGDVGVQPRMKSNNNCFLGLSSAQQQMRESARRPTRGCILLAASTLLLVVASRGRRGTTRVSAFTTTPHHPHHRPHVRTDTPRPFAVIPSSLFVTSSTRRCWSHGSVPLRPGLVSSNPPSGLSGRKRMATSRNDEFALSPKTPRAVCRRVTQTSRQFWSALTKTNRGTLAAIWTRLRLRRHRDQLDNQTAG